MYLFFFKDVAMESSWDDCGSGGVGGTNLFLYQL